MSDAKAEEGRLLVVHPPIVRITHWINVIAIIIMIGSGWRIYNNVPIFRWLEFPIWATLGGDPETTYKFNGDTGFSNALLWHFAGMWLLVLNGVIYVSYGFVSGRFRRKLLPISPRAVLSDVLDALQFRLSHADISMYNAVQKLLYTGILCVLTLIVLSGVSIWKPVQFHELASLFGGFQGARLVHFLCMSAIVLFVIVHVALALIVPQTIVAMITGRARVPAAGDTVLHPAE